MKTHPCSLMVWWRCWCFAIRSWPCLRESGEQFFLSQCLPGDTHKLNSHRASTLRTRNLSPLTGVRVTSFIRHEDGGLIAVLIWTIRDYHSIPPIKRSPAWRGWRGPLRHPFQWLHIPPEPPRHHAVGRAGDLRMRAGRSPRRCLAYMGSTHP